MNLCERCGNYPNICGCAEAKTYAAQLKHEQTTNANLLRALAEAERIVRAVDKVGAEAVANDGRVVLTQGAVLFSATANYLVKHHRATSSAPAVATMTMADAVKGSQCGAPVTVNGDSADEVQK